MQKSDFSYICEHIGNISGLPVRLFKNGEQISFYSVIRLPFDPAVLHRDGFAKIENHVGYFVTSFFDYYGVVNSGTLKLVIGPARQVPALDEDLRTVAFQAGVPRAGTEEFLEAVKKIPKTTLMQLLQLLCLVNFMLNEGEKISLEDIVIYGSEQELLKARFDEDEAERTIRIADGFSFSEGVHSTMSVEESLLYLVRTGNTAALKEMLSHVPAVSGGIIAKDQLRQAKNTFVVTATLVSRSAIHGGLDAEDALSLSDAYIQTCEALNNVESITNLMYRLVFDYAERVGQLHLGNNASKLAAEISNYVRRHLSEPVTVEDVAKHLFRGRSRLSTDFKKETGVNLSDFIMSQKIAEAKKLLRYSGKPISAVTLYLGFSSQSHFTRTFKKFTGVTPKEYREKHAV